MATLHRKISRRFTNPEPTQEVSHMQREVRNSGLDTVWGHTRLPFPSTFQITLSVLPQNYARKEFGTIPYKLVFRYTGRIAKRLG